MNSQKSSVKTSDHRHTLPFNRRTGVAVVAIALSAALGTCNFAHAARLLRFEIYLDDRLIMEAVGGDNGRDDSAAVWSRLGRVEWLPTDGFDVAVQEEDPLRALLNGRIVIQAKHSSKTVLAESAVSGLVLVRDTPEASGWRLPPEEVTRTGIAAGVVGGTDRELVGISPGTIGALALLAGIGLIGALLIVVVVLIAIFSRKQASPERG